MSESDDAMSPNMLFRQAFDKVATSTLLGKKFEGTFELREAQTIVDWIEEMVDEFQTEKLDFLHTMIAINQIFNLNQMLTNFDRHWAASEALSFLRKSQWTLKIKATLPPDVTDELSSTNLLIELVGEYLKNFRVVCENINLIERDILRYDPSTKPEVEVCAGCHAGRKVVMAMYEHILIVNIWTHPEMRQVYFALNLKDALLPVGEATGQAQSSDKATTSPNVQATNDDVWEDLDSEEDTSDEDSSGEDVSDDETSDEDSSDDALEADSAEDETTGADTPDTIEDSLVQEKNPERTPAREAPEEDDEAATCNICWTPLTESPDYEADDFASTGYPPNLAPTGPGIVTEMPCCQHRYHTACVERSLRRDDPTCTRCQKEIGMNISAALMEWKAADLFRRAARIQELIHEQHEWEEELQERNADRSGRRGDQTDTSDSESSDE